MAKFNERETAETLIRAHESGGFKFSVNPGKQKGAYIGSLACMVALLIAVGLFQAWYLFTFLLGFVIGYVWRDQVYFKSFRDTWGFYERVLDWHKVKSIAYSSDKDFAPVDELAM
jgi:hypothetical protein